MSESVAVVIDDDQSVRELLLDVFESAGPSVVVATNGVEGVAAVKERHPLTSGNHLPTTKRQRCPETTHVR